MGYSAFQGHADMSNGADQPNSVDSRMSESQDRIVPFNEAARIRGISRSTQYTRVAAGLISPPRRNGPRLSGWLHSELMAELKQLPTEMPRRPDRLTSKKAHKPPNEKPMDSDESSPPEEK